MKTVALMQDVNIKLRAKIFFAVMLLILVVSAISSYLVAMKSIEQVTTLYEKNTQVIIEKNNDYIDNKLTEIINSINQLTADQDLYDILCEPAPTMVYERANKGYRINNVLLKYFNIRDQDIYSISIITSTYEVGKGSIPYDNFIDTDYYKRAVEADGDIVWEPAFPVYNEIQNDKFDSTYVFACNQLLKSYYVDQANNTRHNLPNSIEKPVLTITLKEKLFEEMFSDDIPTDGTKYFIVTPDGFIASASDNSLIGMPQYDWMDYYIDQDSGICESVIDADKYIVCFDTSEVTEWTTIVLMKRKLLMKEVYAFMGITILLPLLLVPIFSIILIMMMSNTITKPFNILMKVIDKLGEGDFRYRFPEKGPAEVRDFIININSMTDKINQLIIENYEIKIHEKEAQIQALSQQLRPHFMYNTLNLINCIAIEEGNNEISRLIVALSKMLQYTAHNKEELSNFKDEMEWLDNYMYIMCSRFEGKVYYCYDIDPEIYSYAVPRLFLQPFVENAFIHGFESLDRKCKIEIKAWMQDYKRYYSVTDNGIGMPPEKLQDILSEDGHNIGIYNINERIRLFYGDEYGISIKSELDKGTIITVKLPMM